MPESDCCSLWDPWPTFQSLIDSWWQQPKELLYPLWMKEPERRLNWVKLKKARRSASHHWTLDLDQRQNCFSNVPQRTMNVYTFLLCRVRPWGQLLPFPVPAWPLGTLSDLWRPKVLLALCVWLDCLEKGCVDKARQRPQKVICSRQVLSVRHTASFIFCVHISCLHARCTVCALFINALVVAHFMYIPYASMHSMSGWRDETNEVHCCS